MADKTFSSHLTLVAVAVITDTPGNSHGRCLGTHVEADRLFPPQRHCAGAILLIFVSWIVIAAF